MEDQELYINSKIRAEVGRLMLIDPEEVENFGFRIERNEYSAAFQEKAEILFRDIFDDERDVRSALYLSLQMGELAALNLANYMNETGLPGKPVSKPEAHRVAFDQAFPDWVEKEFSQRRALEAEENDLAKGEKHDVATVTQATREMPLPKKTETAKDADDDIAKRTIDMLSSIQRGDTTVYKSPLISATLIESSDRQLVVHGASRMASDAAIDLAEERGWTAINVTGSRSTRQAIWMAGASRGVEVKGYEPTIEDKQWLEKVNPAKAVAEPVKSNVVDMPTKEPRSTAAPPAAPIKADEKSASVYTGKLIEHGEGRFRNDPQGNPSYYVKLETENGAQVTLWGKDLERSINTANATPLDHISLKVSDHKPVKVPVAVKDDNGKIVGTTTKAAKLHIWETTIEKKHQVREPERKKTAEVER